MREQTNIEKQIKEAEKEIAQFHETQRKISVAKTIRDKMLDPSSPYTLRISLYNPKSEHSVADLSFGPETVEGQQIVSVLIDFIIRSEGDEENTRKKLLDILKEDKTMSKIHCTTDDVISAIFFRR